MRIRTIRSFGLRLVVTIGLSLAVCTLPSQAYYSIGSSAMEGGLDIHSAILTDALILAPGFNQLAPDMVRLSDELRDGSTGISGERGAHGGLIGALTSPDGPDDEILNKALEKYIAAKFPEAYERFGNAMHLVQDMTNPTHAFLINHGFPKGDRFDGYATGDGYSQDGAVAIPFQDPGFAKEATIRETKGPPVIPGYWIEGPPGAYGDLKSLFPKSPQPGQDPQYAKLVYNQIGRAISRSHAFMRDVSSLLPPVISHIKIRVQQPCESDFEISERAVLIRFSLRDNRLPAVAWQEQITVAPLDSPDGTPSFYSKLIGPKGVTLEDNKKPRDLPFYLRIRDAELNPICLPKGDVTLVFTTADIEGNSLELKPVEFSIR